MYKAIRRNPDNIVQRSDEGFTKVRMEKYAFIGDETMLLMNASDNCRISLINEKFYKSGFGLAFPERWPYKGYFDKR